MSSTRHHDTSTLQLTCPDCGWSGLGIECLEDEIVEGMINRACPTCGRTLVLGDRVFAWVLEPTGTTPPGPQGSATDQEGPDRS